MPEWVSVWTWLRFMRTPVDMTPLPQQGINPEAMSMATFDELQAEWRKAGSPSMSVNKLVAAMSGAPLAADDDLPF